MVEVTGVGYTLVSLIHFMTCATASRKNIVSLLSSLMGPVWTWTILKPTDTEKTRVQEWDAGNTKYFYITVKLQKSGFSLLLLDLQSLREAIVCQPSRRKRRGYCHLPVGIQCQAFRKTNEEVWPLEYYSFLTTYKFSRVLNKKKLTPSVLNI